jgi:hypothetical protein
MVFIHSEPTHTLVILAYGILIIVAGNRDRSNSNKRG